MLVLKWKERAFIEKVNSRWFCWFPAAILVHQSGAPIWRLHTKLYKGAWNVSANNWETVGHKDMRLGQIVYVLVCYNISFSWLIFHSTVSNLLFCCVTVKYQCAGFHSLSLFWLAESVQWIFEILGSKIGFWNISDTNILSGSQRRLQNITKSLIWNYFSVGVPQKSGSVVPKIAKPANRIA